MTTFSEGQLLGTGRHHLVHSSSSSSSSSSKGAVAASALAEVGPATMHMP